MRAKSIILSLAFLCTFSSLFTQNQTQTIKGIVLDTDTQLPIKSATLVVVGSSPMNGTITDFEGKFELNNVYVDQVRIDCSYLGYEYHLSDPFILNSARATELIIQLIKSVNTTEEVVIKHKTSNLDSCRNSEKL